MAEEITRIDKFLWAVRVYKTRSIATDECRKGRIQVREISVKPSHPVNENDIITVRKPPSVFTYKVIKPISNRISAKLVQDYLQDLTTEEEKEKSRISRSSLSGFRPRGLGRPTKKERRDLERYTDSDNETW